MSFENLLRILPGKQNKNQKNQTKPELLDILQKAAQINIHAWEKGEFSPIL